MIVLFATLSNVDGWEELEDFAQYQEKYLQKYIELKNGIPSHDTIQRVFGMISPDILQQLYQKWQEMLNQEEGEKLKKIICIVGKTMRGNKRKESQPSHIVSAWCREDGFCLGQRVVEEKSNEIMAIPELLDKIQMKGQVVTIDAMGTQTAIAEKIRKKHADYVLALKGNQGALHEDVRLYLSDPEVKQTLQASGQYKRTVEKARSQIEIREYYQTETISWLNCKRSGKD